MTDLANASRLVQVVFALWNFILEREDEEIETDIDPRAEITIRDDEQLSETEDVRVHPRRRRKTKDYISQKYFSWDSNTMGVERTKCNVRSIQLKPDLEQLIPALWYQEKFYVVNVLKLQLILKGSKADFKIIFIKFAHSLQKRDWLIIVPLLLT